MSKRILFSLPGILLCYLGLFWFLSQNMPKQSGYYGLAQWAKSYYPPAPKPTYVPWIPKSKTKEPVSMAKRPSFWDSLNDGTMDDNPSQAPTTMGKFPPLGKAGEGNKKPSWWNQEYEDFYNSLFDETDNDLDDF